MFGIICFLLCLFFCLFLVPFRMFAVLLPSTMSILRYSAMCHLYVHTMPFFSSFFFLFCVYLFLVGNIYWLLLYVASFRFLSSSLIVQKHKNVRNVHSDGSNAVHDRLSTTDNEDSSANKKIK